MTNQRSARLRNIGALLAFIVCMVVVVLGALRYNQAQHEANMPQAKSQAEPLFYTSVGGSPEVLAPSEAEPQASGFVIDLGTFFSKDEAESYVTRLYQKGLQAYYSPYHQKGKVYFRIRYGIVGSEAEAHALAQRIHDQYQVEAHAVRL